MSWTTSFPCAIDGTSGPEREQREFRGSDSAARAVRRRPPGAAGRPVAGARAQVDAVAMTSPARPFDGTVPSLSATVTDALDTNALAAFYR